MVKTKKKYKEEAYFVRLLGPALNKVVNTLSLLHNFLCFSVPKSVYSGVFTLKEVALLSPSDSWLQMVEQMLRSFMV